jgi:hypothetical protein
MTDDKLSRIEASFVARFQEGDLRKLIRAEINNGSPDFSNFETEPKSDLIFMLMEYYRQEGVSTKLAEEAIEKKGPRPRADSAPFGGRRKSRRRGRKSKKMRRRRTVRK